MTVAEDFSIFVGQPIVMRAPSFCHMSVTLLVHEGRLRCEPEELMNVDNF
jgi:hypothetical protein